MCLIICPLRPLPAFLAVCVSNGGGRKFTHTLKFFVATCLHLVFVKLFEFFVANIEHYRRRRTLRPNWQACWPRLLVFGAGVPCVQTGKCVGLDFSRSGGIVCSCTASSSSTTMSSASSSLPQLLRLLQ
jgi:hypothetical protein